MRFPKDYDYIFDIINYLSDRHKESFFISSKDFDVLYNWWENKIPPELIKKSIDNVKKRWDNKGKKINSFINFSYEVKKNLSLRMELEINADEGEKLRETEEYIERFFNNFPGDLKALESDFRSIPDLRETEREVFFESLYDKLIILFLEDEELNLKVKIFMKNLAIQIRKPEIIRKFKINYLFKRYNIPDFYMD